jgi:hypothetical protein
MQHTLSRWSRSTAEHLAFSLIYKISANLIDDQGAVDIALREEAKADVLHNTTADPWASKGFNTRAILSVIHLNVARSTQSVFLNIV